MVNQPADSQPTLFDSPDEPKPARPNQGMAAAEDAEERRRQIADLRGEDLGAEQTGFKDITPPTPLPGESREVNDEWLRRRQRRTAPKAGAAAVKKETRFQANAREAERKARDARLNSGFSS